MLSATIGAFVLADAADRDIMARILDGFGSQKNIAAAVGVGRSAISLWYADRRIPRKRWDEIIAGAAKLDPPLVLTRTDFIAAHRRKAGGVT